MDEHEQTLINIYYVLHNCNLSLQPEFSTRSANRPGLKRSQRMKKNKVSLDSISTSNDINYLMQLIVCDDIQEMITYSKLVGEKYIETDMNALTRIFLIENFDFLEKCFDNDAWIVMKSLVKLYKDKFVCKLCSEPAEKDIIQCKTCQYIFNFKCKDVTAYFKRTYECGRWNAVVLEWPLKTTYNDVNNKKTYFSIHNIRFHRFSVFSFSHFSVF